MSNVNTAMRQQITQAYLAHRLNHSEFTQVTARLQQCESGQASEQETESMLRHFSKVHVDDRTPFEPDQLQDAIEYVYLDRQLEMLSTDKPWTQYERALHRRVSYPEHDPVPMQAQGEGKGSWAFVGQVRKNFEAWDLDRDGALTPVELDTAMANPKLAGPAAAAAVTLRRQGQALARCQDEGKDGVSRQDLEVFLNQGVPEDGSATFRVNRGFSSLSKAVEKLQAPPSLLTEDFDPELVRQGRAGSCVLLSTLATKDAEEVRQMFQPLEDGNVAVTFADGQTQIVRDLTLAERLYHAKSPEDGRWPGLLEVAMGQRLHEKKPKADGSFRSSANGIAPEEASLALHGKPLVKVSLDDLTIEQTRNVLIEMQSAAKPWLAGSRATIKGQDSVVSMEALSNGISNNHAYTIRGYDAETDQVMLRNPWRRGEWVVNFDGQDDGKFSMPLKDFYSSFRWAGAAVSA